MHLEFERQQRDQKKLSQEQLFVEETHGKSKDEPVNLTDDGKQIEKVYQTPATYFFFLNGFEKYGFLKNKFDRPTFWMKFMNVLIQLSDKNRN